MINHLAHSPFWSSEILDSLNANMDKLIRAALLTLKKLAVYSIAYLTYKAGSAVMMSLSHSYYSRLYKHKNIQFGPYSFHIRDSFFNCIIFIV